MPWTTGEPIRIVVVGPPKAWERAGHRIVDKKDGGRFVSTFTPTKMRREQDYIRSIAAKAMGNKAPLDGPIDLRVVAYMPVPASWSKKKQTAALADQIRPIGKPDFDNLIKSLCDAFKHVVWTDDSRVTDPAGPWKRYSSQPRLVIEVRLLTWTA